MASAIRAPSWVSPRRMFEQRLNELHKCTNLKLVKQIQAQMFKFGLHTDPYVVPKLISAFSLCRAMSLAVSVFNMVDYPNVNLYNTLIRAHGQNSQPSLALSLFLDMQRDGVLPDNYTYPFLLKACVGGVKAQCYSLRLVEMVHAHVEKFGFRGDIFVPNSLIDSYSKFGPGGVGSARKVFDTMEDRDTVSWNSMMCGLVRLGELGEAHKLFDEMPQRDVVSWNTVLDGYVKGGDMRSAFELFRRMPERNIVSWSTVVSGYCKVGDLETARMLFDKMPFKSMVPWTVMISGYAEKGLVQEAMSLYREMRKEGLEVDDVSFISILSACAESGFLQLGQMVHSSVEVTRRFRCSVAVYNALIDMYAKCGSLNRSVEIFEGMKSRDLVSWNVIIQGLAMHGHGEDALKLFYRMKQEGIKPDGITIIGVLCACTHMGYVDKGLEYFYTMETDYGITPQVEHYGCLIDLLGRGGRLKQAIDVIHSMPIEPNAIIWGTLLLACRMHNDVELANEVLNRLDELESQDATNLSVLSNIYASVGDWRAVSSVRMRMQNIGNQKPSGSSSVEVDDQVHKFTVFDRSHPGSDEIYQMIDMLRLQLRRTGELQMVVED